MNAISNYAARTVSNLHFGRIYKAVVVEDNKGFRTGLVDMLTSLHSQDGEDTFEANVADNLEDGLKTVNQGPVDILFVDGTFPEKSHSGKDFKSGPELVRKVVANKERPTRIVGMSDGDRNADFKQAGADDFLDKGHMFDDLIHQLELLIGKPVSF